MHHAKYRIPRRLLAALLALTATILAAGPAPAAKPALPAQAQARLEAVCGRTDVYDCYTNHKYGYVLAWPKALLTPMGEADDGGGQLFTTPDEKVELACWAMYANVLNKSLDQLYREAQSDFGADATYKHKGADFFVLSGVRDGKIFYRKTVSAHGVQASFELRYDPALKDRLDPVAADLARAFVVHPEFAY